MPRRTRFVLSVAVCTAAVLVACGGFGQVNQGRVIAQDVAAGTVTLILEPSRSDRASSPYGVLPPQTIHTPGDPRQMGPVPRTGRLMLLDLEARKAVIFDTTTQSFKSVAFELTERREDVPAGDASVKGASFPRVDRAAKTVTVYSPERRRLVTLKVPEEWLDLPADTWEVGDEIRYYYKNPGQALRLMNVTRSGQP